MLKRTLLLFAGALSLVPLWGQRYQLTTSSGEPLDDGQWRLRQVGETEAEFALHAIIVVAKMEARIPLLEDFAARFPKHPAYPWALEQAQIICQGVEAHDKVVALGERLLAHDPLDVDAFRRLWGSVKARKEPELLRKWAVEAWRLAPKVAAMAVPPKAKAETVAGWKQAAAQMAAEAEHALYTRVFETEEPAARLKAIDEFLAAVPDTQYRRQCLKLQLAACQQMNEPRKTLDAAERVLKVEPDNEEVLILAAQIYLDRRIDLERAVTYANRALATLRTRQKPEDIAAERWERQRSLHTGMAQLILGSAYLSQTKFVLADQHLRVALPLLRQNEQSYAAILFYLGWVNYNLEKFAESAQYFKQCLAIRSQYSAQAMKNLDIMRRDRRINE